jgi:uncharacterized protein (AIM24 family)
MSIGLENSEDNFTLQNSYMLKAKITQGQEVIVLKHSVVASQGDIGFHKEGPGGVVGALKKINYSNMISLTRLKGDGDVFLAHKASLLHIVELKNEDITVSGRNVLAFDAALTYNSFRVHTGGMLDTDTWNLKLSGSGKVAISANGKPVLFDCSQQPLHVATSAAIAWSSSVAPRIDWDSDSYIFHGQGWVLVQPSDIPVNILTTS